jgi:hypothetical protein
MLFILMGSIQEPVENHSSASLLTVKKHWIRLFFRYNMADLRVTRSLEI